ncbi:hypothetical protein RhiirA4_427137 [Rhizophagus irregularis]|uniref:RRM domain-containing protein n=1 Tax=Rhizophagus irregularis TaxID=588596 RepID=A0A2I1H7U9_9GLOM|nr:hypothetical protein RhiirA4_427137 [Rhizophagus irregularis]
MDLKRMNIVPKTSKTPSWFTHLTNTPNLSSFLPHPILPTPYPPPLLTLQGVALATIDEQSHIKARNRYYWIAGLDGSDTMIFGRVFYTVDVHGTCIVYFSHWVNSSSDRLKISPCQGCSLHDDSIEDGPLQVRSVGSKLSHRSCLTFLPSYRCLQLFHMSSRIDSTCNNINLFLSPFLLCSFFKILLGYSCVRIPELFLVDSSSLSLPTEAIVSTELPGAPSTFNPELHVTMEQHIYLHAKSSVPKPMSSNDIICGWVQQDDDLILSSGTFSWTNGPISPQSTELGFILRTLQLLPRNSSVHIYSVRPYESIFSSFQRSSSERRIRFPYYVLWIAISICIHDSQINCRFHTVADVSVDAYLSRCLTLSGLPSVDDPNPSFMTLLEFPSLRRLSINLLCTGVPLVMDPVHFWHNISDMHEFFSILSLSRFAPLRSSYSSVDWQFTFDLIKDTLYHRLDVSRISTLYRFRLQLWFDELPLMSQLRFRYPGLYADDSLCPNCGIFMETLDHFFTCLPDSLSIIDQASPPASEWSSLEIFWTHSAIIRGTNWLNNLSDFLKSRTVLVRFKLLSSLRTYKTMTTPRVPSVINSDVLLLPHPDISAPAGDRPLSPSNDASAPNKRTRTVSSDDMEVETTTTTTTTSGPASGLVSTVPSGLPVNKVTVLAQPQTQTINVSLDSSMHAHPLPASTVPPNNDKGKSVAFDIPARQPSSDGNAAAIKSSPSRFHAAAYLHDAPVAFKEKFTTNRTISKARCEGSGDNKRILVYFFVQDDHSACIQSPCADLLDLVFTPYSPAEARRSDEEKSLFVTDIPLFLNETQIRQAFSRYGTVENSLRVCPASYLKSQRDSRREHVAILAGIPKNIKEADLFEIASQVNAKAINIPLSYNSYKPKPYAYFNFASFKNLEAAKELTIAFRGKGLSWHSPNEAHELYHVCGRHGCSPSKCSPRPAKKTNDRLNKLYTRFNAGPKRGRSDSRQARSSSGSRVEALEYSISDYNYRIGELEAMMNYDDSSPHQEDSSYQPDSHTQQDCGWDNEPYHNGNDNSFSLIQQGSNPSLMDKSPDVSFSTLDLKSALSQRHVPLPVRVNYGNPPNDTHLRQEILSIFSTHKDITNQLGSTLNVRSLVHASKQFNLFSLLLSYQLHGLILTETNLQSPSHKYVCEPYLSQYNYHKWFSFSSSANHHAGVGILLHSCLAIDIRAPSYLKQRSRYRTVYNFHAALPDQKVLFTSEVDEGLKSNQISDMNNNLNRTWHRFKTALLNAARSTFLKQVISLNKTKKTPAELQPYQHISHKLDYYIRSLYGIFTISELYGSWNRFYPSFCPIFLELFSDRMDLINQFPVPTSLYSEFISSNLPFKTYLNNFKGLLRPVQRLISAKLKLEFNNYKNNAMKSAIAERNANFYEDKGKFICSSLNREKRSIVLDRVLVTNIPGNPQLLIAPDDIHAAAVKHFQNVVGPSRSPFKSLHELPER